MKLNLINSSILVDMDFVLVVVLFYPVFACIHLNCDLNKQTMTKCSIEESDFREEGKQK